MGIDLPPKNVDTFLETKQKAFDNMIGYNRAG
jgi:hypothetical protein